MNITAFPATGPNRRILVLTEVLRQVSRLEGPTYFGDVLRSVMAALEMKEAELAGDFYDACTLMLFAEVIRSNQCDLLRRKVTYALDTMLEPSPSLRLFVSGSYSSADDEDDVA